MGKVVREGDGRRLDALLSGGDVSRSRAAKLIGQGMARVNGVVVLKTSFIPRPGDAVELVLPEPAETVNLPENIPLRILFQDDALAVVVKPAGLAVHPAAGRESGTLVNALLYHLDSLSGIGGEKRPGIVHRLDKDTSGLLLVAKNDRAHLALSQALANREIRKYYLAEVSGRMGEEAGEMDGPIARSPKDRKKMAVVPGGRTALTRWQLVRQDTNSALVLIRLVTGRTHQIRVHFSHAGRPVLGDPIYGHSGRDKTPRLMLHAWRLVFRHPLSDEEMRFTAPPDPLFRAPQERELDDLIAGYGV